MKVSFDFDGTLDRQAVQKYAKKLINKGFEVWICTSRLGNSIAVGFKYNADLFAIAKKIHIPKKHIMFMNMADKSEFFEGTDFIWHLDDSWTELAMINERTDIVGVSVFGNSIWRSQCEEIIRARSSAG